MNDRLRNAFKAPSLLSDEDISEIQRRCIADNKEWKRRKNRIENVGEILEGSRTRNQSKVRKPKLNSGIRRELSEAEKVQLLRAWG